MNVILLMLAGVGCYSLWPADTCQVSHLELEESQCLETECKAQESICYIECSSKVSASSNKENRRELHFMCRMFVLSILTLFLVNCFTVIYQTRNTVRPLGIRARIFKHLWSPGIDSKELILPAYVALRAGTITLFLLGS